MLDNDTGSVGVPLMCLLEVRQVANEYVKGGNNGISKTTNEPTERVLSSAVVCPLVVRLSTSLW